MQFCSYNELISVRSSRFCLDSLHYLRSQSSLHTIFIHQSCHQFETGKQLITSSGYTVQGLSLNVKIDGIVRFHNDFLNLQHSARTFFFGYINLEARMLQTRRFSIICKWMEENIIPATCCPTISFINMLQRFVLWQHLTKCCPFLLEQIFDECRRCCLGSETKQADIVKRTTCKKSLTYKKELMDMWNHWHFTWSRETI